VTILTDSDANRRLRLLSDLREALSALGIESVLVRNHRLVLRYRTAPYEASGLTDPQLHVFTAGVRQVATTDGTAYWVDRAAQFLALDAADAATFICGAGHG
jgi:hypothetical protein